MLKTNLLNILNDLNKISNDKDTLKNCVSFRLDKSFKQYKQQIDDICKYLLSRDSYKVLKELAKKDKGVIKHGK